MDRIELCMEGTQGTDKKKISGEAFFALLGRKANLSVPFVHAVVLSVLDPY